MKSEKYITLVRGEDDVVEVELLCAFEMSEDNNRYIIYTKNEKDEYGHTIIYSGKIHENNGRQYLININDNGEWDKIKDVMKEMARYANSIEGSD